MNYPLAREGVFRTLQGEGAQQGEPMTFVRLAGCSVGCPDCDTDYAVSRRVDIETLLADIRAVTPATFVRPWVWLTGGEPTDHDLGPLIDALRTVGYRVALATAGVRPVPPEWNLGWLSVSPHSVTVPQRFGHELKVVPGLNGLTWSDLETIDAQWHSFPWRYIQPLWYSSGNGPEHDGAASQESVRKCIEFVLTHPGWRLTTQVHKQWGLR